MIARLHSEHTEAGDASPDLAGQAEIGAERLQFSAHNRLETSASKSTLAAGRGNPHLLAVLNLGERWAKPEVGDVFFSPDGRQVITIETERSRRWNADTGAELSAAGEDENGIFLVAFSPDGCGSITLEGNNQLKVLDVATGAERAALQAPEGEIKVVGFSHDGSRIITISSDGFTRVWDAESGETIAMLQSSDAGGEIGHAVQSPDGTRMVTWAEIGFTQIKESLISIIAEDEYVSEHDPVQIIACDNTQPHESFFNTPRLWSVNTGSVIAGLRGHRSYVTCSAFSPDGTLVVTGSYDTTARIWDAHTGAEIAVLRGHERQLLTAAFSPTGEWLLTASRAAIRLWNPQSLSMPFLSFVHDKEVAFAGFSPDGLLVVGMYQDHTTRLWETATGELVAELIIQDVEGGLVAFSMDGKTLATVGTGKGKTRERIVCLWEMPSAAVHHQGQG